MSCRRWHRRFCRRDDPTCELVKLDKWRQRAMRTSGAFLAALLLICLLPPLVPPLYLHPSHLSLRCSSSAALTYFHWIVIVCCNSCGVSVHKNFLSVKCRLF